MPFDSLSRPLLLLLFLQTASCGPEVNEVNENCRAPQEISDGQYKSVPKTVASAFPLAVATSDISMKIDKENKTVKISYVDGGKTIIQNWRIE